jgi:hypothetical protein
VEPNIAQLKEGGTEIIYIPPLEMFGSTFGKVEYIILHHMNLYK